MATNLTNITVETNGTSTSYPIQSGKTAGDLLANQDFRDLFQIPDNVVPVINGQKTDRVLFSGDTLSFETKASSKQ